MRIRSIKPEFWTSEDVAELDWSTRLLFIGLWSYVDDNGVGRDNAKLIKADLFPLEDDPRETLATVSRGLQALCDAGLIARYTVAGKPFLHITTWESHQRIDRPNKPRYPLPTCDDAVARETLASVSRDPREGAAPGAGEQRSRGTEEEPPRAFARETETPDGFEDFWDAYDKKVGRKRAEQKYRGAVRRHGVDPQRLLVTASAYVKRQKAAGKHPEFTKDAATWLTGEHWEDESVPAATVHQLPHVSEIESPPNGLSDEEYDLWLREHSR